MSGETVFNNIKLKLNPVLEASGRKKCQNVPPNSGSRDSFDVYVPIRCKVFFELFRLCVDCAVIFLDVVLRTILVIYNSIGIVVHCDEDHFALSYHSDL